MTKTRGKPPIPVGVALFALYHIVVGLGAVGVMCLMLPGLLLNGNPLGPLEVQRLVFSAAATLLTAFMLFSGIGLLLGTPWGWWLTTFVYVNSVVISILTVIAVCGLGIGLAGAAGATPGFAVKHIIRNCISALILSYFFKDNVREYCDTQDVEWTHAVFANAGLTLSLAAVAFIVMKAFR